MPFFQYDDILFDVDLRYGNEDMEMEKAMVASHANTLMYRGTYYIERKGYSTIEAKILITIRIHNLVKHLINLIIKIEELKKFDPFNNLRLIKLIESLLISSIDSLQLIKRFQKTMETITDYDDGKIYYVNEFFEKNIDFCNLLPYRKDIDALIGYNQITTELGALMGVYDMLFGEELLKINKKYTTKYLFKYLKIKI